MNAWKSKMPDRRFDVSFLSSIPICHVDLKPPVLPKAPSTRGTKTEMEWSVCKMQLAHFSRVFIA